MIDRNESADGNPAGESASGSQSKATSTPPGEESSDDKVSKRDAAKLATDIAEAKAEWIRLMRKDAAMKTTAAPGIVKAMGNMLLPAGFLAELSKAVKTVSLTPNQRAACGYLCEHALKEKSPENPASATPKSGPA